MTNNLVISSLFTYPIKGCGGFALNSAFVTQRGLQYDRRWMLVDEKMNFISQRDTSTLALIKPRITENELSMQYLDKKISIPFVDRNKSYETRMVHVWDDACIATIYDEKINDWFTQILARKCSLVYMEDIADRPVDLTYAPPGHQTSFSDGYPILLLGQSSMDLLNEKMMANFEINRFRPNIVFKGGEPNAEDEINFFKINDALLQGVKLCGRCNVPNIDQSNGVSSLEPTATLAGYRLFNKKILFGQNVIIHKGGVIKIGDAMELM